MKLALISVLAEGFGFQTEHDPQALLAAQPPGKKGAGGFKSFFQGSTLYFKPEDSPSDIVKVVPALEQKDLSTYVDDKALPNFKGTIFYGFKTVAGDEYRTSGLDKILVPLEKALAIAGGKIPEALTVGQCRRLAAMARTGDVRSRYPQDVAKADALEAAAKIAVQVRTAYGWKGKRGSSPEDFCIHNAMQLVKQRTGNNYAHDAAYELARRLKKPQSGDEQIVTQFIDLCETQLAKIDPIAYDYVVAPQSSGSFNKALAKRLADTRGSEFLEIQKHLGKNVTVNRDQLYQQGLRNAPKAERDGKFQRHQMEVVEEHTKRERVTYEYDTPEEYASDWADNEHQKLEKYVSKMPKSKPAEIKDQEWADKRRYMKLFNPEGAEKAAGQTVLMVDDNMVSGGTIELVYEILQGLTPPPRRLDIFIPLLLS